MQFSTRHAVALAVLAGIAAVGCDDTTDPASDDPATSEAPATSSTSSNQIDVDDLDLVEVVDRTREVDSGRFDYSVGFDTDVLGSLDLSLRAQVASFAGTRFSSVADAEAPFGIGSVETIVDGDDAWFRYTGDGEVDYPLEPDTWMRGSVEQFRSAEILETTVDGAFGPLDLLVGADETELVGNEPVGDVETTRIDVSVSLADAIEQVPEERRGALNELISVEGAREPVVFDGAVWVDGERRVRRLQLTASGEFGDADDTATSDGPFGSPGGFEITVELTISDPDGVIEIATIPTGDQVLDADDVLGS